MVSVGPARAREALRTALAMGADSTILVEIDEEDEPLAVAKTLKAAAEESTPILMILGKQAFDDDTNQTGPTLAALRGRPQGVFANRMVVKGYQITVTRESDFGLETVELSFPAIITVDLRLNESRYASLPNIMTAKKKLLDITTNAIYGVDIAPRLKAVRFLSRRRARRA